jgi:hypothetical protein
MRNLRYNREDFEFEVNMSVTEITTSVLLHYNRKLVITAFVQTKFELKRNLAL